MSNNTDRQLVWIVLAIAAALVVLPAVGMGFGMMGVGSMMDGSWSHGMWAGDGMPWWIFVVGVGMQLLFLALVVGAIYLGYRALTGQEASTDPAIEELRAAYARGELSDEEFERSFAARLGVLAQETLLGLVEIVTIRGALGSVGRPRHSAVRFSARELHR
jgi:putative membrane protein